LRQKNIAEENIKLFNQQKYLSFYTEIQKSFMLFKQIRYNSWHGVLITKIIKGWNETAKEALQCTQSDKWARGCASDCQSTVL
jgi:hypothetical protein